MSLIIRTFSLLPLLLLVTSSTLRSSSSVSTAPQEHESSLKIKKPVGFASPTGFFYCHMPYGL
jgi:hypothetical protein